MNEHQEQQEAIDTCTTIIANVKAHRYTHEELEELVLSLIRQLLAVVAN